MYYIHNGESIIKHISYFVHNETKYHLLNYHYITELDNTQDEEYVYKLKCLYEWWEQEQNEMLFENMDDIDYPVEYSD